MFLYISLEKLARGKEFGLLFFNLFYANDIALCVQLYKNVLIK